MIWQSDSMFLDNYEEFTESQIKILEKYVTNTGGSVFALKNLPEVIKGALFSRYSRSNLGLRSLLLKEFVGNEEEASFEQIVGKETTSKNTQDQTQAIQKAQSFYDRILDGYGDDSIGELGGAHLALENISMLAAKFIEDLRIGGSPLEKSTRYIFFDQKVQGEYLYYREPVLMTSAFRSLYIEACDLLFDTYGQLIPPLTEYFEKLYPKDPAGSKAAYTAAIRAKVLDCLRGLLPASTLTNMGIFGNGRFFEHLLHRANVSNLAEMQELGKRSFQELTKVIPSFVRRGSVTHKTHQAYAQYHEAVETEIRMLAAQYAGLHSEPSEAGVKLISFDSESPSKVAAAALFQVSPFSLGDLNALAKDLPEEEINRILDTISNLRENRRHKSPRALEHANFTFEIVSDFGTYRDLHRHRMLTQERQLLTCDLGYFIPHEIMGTPLEEPYVRAMEQAKAAYDTVAQELPEEAQYIVPMAYNVRWYFHINLRSLQWLCELRSQAAGHPTYRYIAQALAHETIKQFPQFERFFKFVDYEGYELGRLGQEERREAKKGHLA